MAEGSELFFPFKQPPELGLWHQPVPGVCWLRMPLPFALDHINLWLIEEHGGWAIVDTGYALPTVQQAWSDILAGLDAPITRIIVTHYHPDHMGLALWLQEKTGAPLHMTTGEYLTAHAMFNEIGGHGTQPMIQQFTAHGMDPDRLAGLQERGNAYRKGVQGLPESYLRLMNGDTLRLGDHVWQVICGYGHSPEHVSLYCAGLGVLISGDMLLPRISTNVSVFAATPFADVLGQYLSSLAQLEAQVPDTVLVLPSHGLPFRGIRSRVQALTDHHAQRLKVLEAGCQAEASAGTLLTVLFERPLDTHQTMFAMGETIAHLNHLEKLGRLCRRVDSEGKIFFSRV